MEIVAPSYEDPTVVGEFQDLIYVPEFGHRLTDLTLPKNVCGDASFNSSANNDSAITENKSINDKNSKFQS